MIVLLVVADVGRIGIGICYDIRFQELAMIYAARGESSYHNALSKWTICFLSFSGPLRFKEPHHPHVYFNHIRGSFAVLPGSL
jgi:hypothetical protein